MIIQHILESRSEARCNGQRQNGFDHFKTSKLCRPVAVVPTNYQHKDQPVSVAPNGGL